MCQGPEVVKRSMLSDRGTVQGTVPFVAGMWSGELGRQREARVFCRGGLGQICLLGSSLTAK